MKTKKPKIIMKTRWIKVENVEVDRYDEKDENRRRILKINPEKKTT